MACNSLLGMLRICKIGNKTAFAIKFAADYGAQVLTSVLNDMVNGQKALSYTYTASQRVAGITDKSGKKTIYQYDNARRVVAFSDNGKVIAEYRYYEDGNLMQIKFANGIIIEYNYNVDKNCQRIITQTAEGDLPAGHIYKV